VKEIWDETSTNDQKSHYQEKYLSTLLKQINILSKGWDKNDIFINKSAKIEIQHKFDNFKKEIKSLQKKKKLLDASLPDVSHQSKSLISNFASLFHHHKEHKNEMLKNEINDTVRKTPSNNMI
jgi:cupin superfamily acireductone dioxygenase involved in methionine salvage